MRRRRSLPSFNQIKNSFFCATISSVKSQITFDDFAKLDLRVGEVLEAKEIGGSEKLVGLTVDLGPEVGKKIIYAGIKKWYEPASLVGRKLVFVVNLEPKVFKIGDTTYTSEGMVVAAGEDEAVLYTFDKDLPGGTMLR